MIGTDLLVGNWMKKFKGWRNKFSLLFENHKHSIINNISNI
jgi:hypothetical protein